MTWYARGRPSDRPHFSRNGDIQRNALQPGEVVLELADLPDANLVISNDGEKLIAPPDAARLATERAWHDVRAHRVALLERWRWTVAPDSPLSEECRAEWLVYLKTLNRITVDHDDPLQVAWPAEPGLVYEEEK